MQSSNVPSSLWEVSGEPVTIDEFIVEGRKGIEAPGFRAALRPIRQRLLEKVESIDAEEHPELWEDVHVIIQILDSPEAWQAEDPLPHRLAEAAFGARYLLKRFDLIADHIPEIGLADDARLLARIVERNDLKTLTIWASLSRANSAP